MEKGVTPAPLSRLAQGRPKVFVVQPASVLLAAVVLYGAFQVVVSVHRYLAMHAFGLDLGYFEQVMWKISHGDWWAYSSVLQTPAVAADGSLALYPVAYLFRFAGGPYVLFVLQAVGTAIAAWGVYRAALALRLGGWAACLGGCLLLLAPGIIGASQFDYHPDFIALPLLVWAYVAYLEGRRLAYFLLALAAVLSKNIALVGFIGLGVGLLVYKRDWRSGLTTLLGSFALVALEWGWLFPRVFHAQSAKIDLSLYGYLGHGLLGIARGLVVHFPIVVAHVLADPSYLLWAVGPLAGLCLLGGPALPAGLALVVMNAVSTFASQQTFTNQYQVMLTGWLVLAAMEGAARLRVGRRAWLAVAAALTGLAQLAAITARVVPLFHLPEAPATALASQVSQVRMAPATVVWTQSRLGARLYKYRVLGYDLEIVPGTMVDGLPALWREAPAGWPTALVGSVPVSPYFATVLSQAMHAGYRVTFHRGRVFVVRGSRHFSPVSASPGGLGYEPSSRQWIIPAWTQASKVGEIDWTDLQLIAPARRPGLVLAPMLLQLAPGEYEVSAAVRDGPNADGALGVVRLAATSGSPRVSATIHAGSRFAILMLHVTHPSAIALSVGSYGHAAWALGTVTITRLVASHHA